MAYYSKKDLEKLPPRFRSNLINSCTGYKSCNLIGTISQNGTSNLAIFNSVMHIGSNPALLGFVLRPLTVRRDSYNNFKTVGHFTVNQVNTAMIKASHKTSAKYDAQTSEFAQTGLTEEYLDRFPAPYVKESAIKIGCSYLNEYEIKENGCLLVIGSIERIYIPASIQQEDGWVKLDEVDTISAIGLDGYALPKLLARFAYARPTEEVKEIEHDED